MILAGNDQVSGSRRSDTLYGFAGNDRMRGLAGNDVIEGGDGDDILDGGAGRDRRPAEPGTMSTGSTTPATASSIPRLAAPTRF